MSAPITVALLGGGTVGAQVARLILEQSTDLAARIGAPLELVGVGVRDASRPREGIPFELLTDDPVALVARGSNIVVEVMGGIEPARSLILEAMAAGSSVVTANRRSRIFLLSSFEVSAVAAAIAPAIA